MNTLTIYTDGSCSPNPGKGGWAYIALLENLQIENYGGSIHTTNNIMEMTAVIEALKDFKDTQKFKIYSDSLYVINCAKKIWKRNKNIELWNEYDTLSKNKEITFIWVKGHNGDIYNEMVDKLAKYGAK